MYNGWRICSTFNEFLLDMKVPSVLRTESEQPEKYARDWKVGALAKFTDWDNWYFFFHFLSSILFLYYTYIYANHMYCDVIDDTINLWVSKDLIFQPNRIKGFRFYEWVSKDFIFATKQNEKVSFKIFLQMRAWVVCFIARFDQSDKSERL